jgi:hypothetical protein
MLGAQASPPASGRPTRANPLAGGDDLPPASLRSSRA